MGNNIDDIFKKAIEPLDTEPSEEFWRKAAEDIIAKGSKATEQKVFRWRAIAFILGAGLLILGYFTYRTQSSLEEANQQIKVAEDGQTKQTDNVTGNNTAKNEDKTTVTPTVNKTATTHTKSDLRAAISANTRVNSQHVKENNSLLAANNRPDKLNNSSANSKVANYNVNRNLAVNHKKTVVPATHKPTKPTMAAANQKNEVTASIPSNNSSNQQSDAAVQTKMYALAQPVTQSDDSATNQADASDTTNDIVEQGNTVNGLPGSSNAVQNKLQINDSLAKFRVSAFFSPDYLVGYGFNSSDPLGAQIENTIKQGEKEKFSYTVGAKAEYALSYNFSIGAGLAYEVYAFNINPFTIYAQKQSDGDVGYYFTTSSGVAECPSYGYTTVGESIRMNASSSRRYLQVPLLAKYYLVNARKLRCYAVLGLEPCFNLGDNIVMNWQNSWGEGGSVTVNNMEGSRNFYFSYYVGLGVTYKVAKYFSIYLEPGLHNAVTPIDDQIAVTTSPKLLSATVGLTYTVK